ncbi:polyunsaturated fatty acid 5-lipoxygenase-like isoform X2 [Montipora capricornis]|uniref:polyunsaturated fatty acid 5-lipoxygenase-like isoform X2 n=1 Tax=Montipora capricornis TaxID=246305 RepID=UPI0035F16759
MFTVIFLMYLAFVGDTKASELKDETIRRTKEFKKSGIAGCAIVPFHRASKACKIQRQQELLATRQDYVLKKSSIECPFACLNKTLEEVLRILLKDALNSHWIRLYNSTIWKNLGLFFLFDAKTKGTEFQTEGDFTRTYNFFVANRFHGVNTNDTKYFQFQFEDPNIPFRNLSELALWRDDEAFTDQRLAGLNPMAIERVSWDPARIGGVDWTDLCRKLNPKFNWEGATQDVLGMDISLSQAVEEGYIYAVQYPLYKRLEPKRNDPFGTVMDAFSPIAIFASKPSRHTLTNRLKPVAIQLDSSKDSAVFTPMESELWLMAKHALQATDFAQTQVIEHLSNIHLFMEPICVCVNRQFSQLHPMHQILKYHCRGLIGTNKLGYPFLVAPGKGTLDKLLTVGAEGAFQMIRRAYQNFNWERTDFLDNIKNRGLDDKTKLPYFPYRDDGELIHESITRMVNEYVNLYYKSNKEIKKDKELQNFASDVSVGSGKVKRFPTKFTTKAALKKHLIRIIWVLTAQHSVVNYPADHIGALTPNMPTKLYKDNRVGVDHYSIYNLPRRFTGGAQVSLGMALASLRYDTLFDYAQSLQDTKAGHVVQKYYNYLHGYVKSIIKERNDERFEKGYLPYPYLVPGWIANSVHT